MCLQTFHGVEKTPLFYYNNQHQEKRFGGSKKGIRFSKKFFETHRKPHGYWVPVISVTKDKNRQASQDVCRFFAFFALLFSLFSAVDFCKALPCFFYFRKYNETWTVFYMNKSRKSISTVLSFPSRLLL